jgi:hypothetical protein
MPVLLSRASILAATLRSSPLLACRHNYLPTRNMLYAMIHLRYLAVSMTVLNSFGNSSGLFTPSGLAIALSQNNKIAETEAAIL